MNILGIETSCDETAAAVVRDGREVLANVVYTQIPLHQPYGGVVPEIASRAHIEKISQVVGDAIRQFEQSNNRTIDAVAVTYGPGLSPALIVGLNAAKGLAKALGVPLLPVNHIEGHLHSPFLFDAGENASSLPRVEDAFPALGLAVSGGNTLWVDMPELCRYEVIGETLDDAAGEAFDKAAKLLGLGYPGGLKMDRIASAWMSKVESTSTSNLKSQISDLKNSTSASLLRSQISDLKFSPTTSLIPFPKGRPRDGVAALSGLAAELCVSFSGLKTALLRYVQQHPELLAAKGEVRNFGGYEVTSEVARVVASYQEAIAGALADRTRTALKRRRYRSLILGGGVSLNSRIREMLKAVAAEAGVPLLMAKPKYTGDNGAMIAALAYYRGSAVAEPMKVDVNPSLEVGV